MAGPIKATRVRSERIDWLRVKSAPNRIPKGMLSVVAGRPDQSKGLFAITLGADVTKAGGNVLHSAIEDHFGKMTKPRYRAAGADLNHLDLWRFILPAQFTELEKHVVDHNIDLLVLDPFAAHLGGGVSRHSDNIRTVLTPLSELMEATDCACLIVEHALKRIPVHGDPLNAIGGTGSGLPAAARMAFVFGTDPSDEDHRILACVKANIREKPKALTFLMDTVELDVGPIPALTIDDEVEFDPMRLFDGRYRHGAVGRPPDKRKAAAEWLTAYLVQHGATKVKKIREDAKQYGLAKNTLYRAAEDMQIVKTPPGGGPNVVWDFSDDVRKMLEDDDEEAIEAKAEQIAKSMKDGPPIPPDKPKLDDGETLAPSDLDKFLARVLEADERQNAGGLLDGVEDDVRREMEKGDDATT